MSKSSTLEIVFKTIRVYKEGISLIYSDMKELYVISTKKNALCYTDLSKRRRIIYDLLNGIPLMIIFLVPFVGNTIPLIGYFFPIILPSVWVSPRQRAKMILECELRKKSWVYKDDWYALFVGYRAPVYVLTPLWLKRRLGNTYGERIELENTLLNKNYIENTMSKREMENALYDRGESFLSEVLNVEAVESIPIYIEKNGRSTEYIKDVSKDALKSKLLHYMYTHSDKDGVSKKKQ